MFVAQNLMFDGSVIGMDWWCVHQIMCGYKCVCTQKYVSFVSDITSHIKVTKTTIFLYWDVCLTRCKRCIKFCTFRCRHKLNSNFLKTSKFAKNIAQLWRFKKWFVQQPSSSYYPHCQGHWHHIAESSDRRLQLLTGCHILPTVHQEVNIHPQLCDPEGDSVDREPGFVTGSPSNPHLLCMKALGPLNPTLF